MFSKEIIKQFNFPTKINGLSSEQYDKIENTFVSDYFNFIYKHNLIDFPLISVKNSGIASLPKDYDKSNNPAILTLMNLKLIDASSATWEQIIEFRKDPHAKSKLRKLRLFAYENYTGRSKNYVEDDINA